MPPKVKTTREDIVSTALSLVRARGAGALNARAVAAALGCSTQPVFSNFATMEELEAATGAAAYAHYLDFAKKEVESEKYPPYKALGMAYMRFAKEERELFRLLFMRDRSAEDTSPTPEFEGAAEMIAAANSVSLETARLMHLEMWAWVHGVGTLLATSFLSLDWSLIEEMLSDVYWGIRARHVKEGQA